MSDGNDFNSATSPSSAPTTVASADLQGRAYPRPAHVGARSKATHEHHDYLADGERTSCSRRTTSRQQPRLVLD